MFPDSAKGRGHLAELLVATEATKKGFTVLWPGGDNAPFDMVLLTPTGKFFKVQVKSCLQKEPGRERWTYTTKKGSKKRDRAYAAEEVDIMALYAFDSGDFYMIPLQEIINKKSIKIVEGGEFAKFKNEWTVFS